MSQYRPILGKKILHPVAKLCGNLVIYGFKEWGVSREGEDVLRKDERVSRGNNYYCKWDVG